MNNSESEIECPEFKLYGKGKGYFYKVEPHPNEKELIECYKKTKNPS